MPRPEKKSESLEIRLPYSQKQAFMEACRERGVTASDVLRGFIAEDISEGEGPKATEHGLRTAARNHPFKTAAGAAATAFAAATFGAGASFAGEEPFERFDKNQNGEVSYSEFVGELRDGETSASVSGEELVGYSQPPTPQTYRGKIFQGLDRDGSQSLSADEFSGEGQFARRTDDLIDHSGHKVRLIGLEFHTYDLTEAGSVSMNLQTLSRIVPVDADEADLAEAFAALEAEAAAIARR